LSDSFYFFLLFDSEKYGGRFCQCTAEEAKNQTLCR